MAQLYGFWKMNVNAGGAEEKFWSNPQYLIQVNELQANEEAYEDGDEDEDEDDEEEEEEEEEEAQTSIILSLCQRYNSQMRVKSQGSYENSYHSIKFHIYAVDENLSERKVQERVVGKKKFTESELKLFDSSGAYGAQRAITKRCYLSAGYYVIIPSTIDKNVEAEYLIRVYHDKFAIASLFELH
jgi:hypothetical protein